MENNCLIPNFDGFQITLNKSSDSIYFRILNSVTYQCYETSISQSDLRNGNVNNIQKAFVLYKKSFMKEDHYNVVMEVKEGNITLLFTALFDECFELSSKITIPEIVSSDEMDVSSALVRVEMKQKEDNQELERKFNQEISNIMKKMIEMESIIQVMLDCEICIGTLCNNANLTAPFYTSLNTINLEIKTYQAINQALSTIREYNCGNNYIYQIFYGRIRKLKFMKKLVFERDITRETEIRNAYTNRQGHNHLPYETLQNKDLDMIMPDKFDFGKFYNGVLEKFSITHLNGVATLESVEKMETLTSLEIVNADQLSNASTYIAQLPNLKNLTFKNCPKIASDDSAKLQDYCRKKNITLSIS